MFNISSHLKYILIKASGIVICGRKTSLNIMHDANMSVTQTFSTSFFIAIEIS